MGIFRTSDEKKLSAIQTRMQLTMAEMAEKNLKEVALSYSFNRAADTGRRNRDWNPPQGSADLSWVPESRTVLARARDIARNTWAGKAISNAYADNVVGRGIRLIPCVADSTGKKLSDINSSILEAWQLWCRKEHCDVEKTKTFAQMQELAIREWVAAGEIFPVWSYQSGTNSVGLRLQCLEADQLYLLFVTYEGNEVRGGIEVDQDGAPIAYHFYQRNPNDLTYVNPAVFTPVRLPFQRVMHFYTPERCRQSRGVSVIVPVMQDIRDAESYRNAVLTAQRMQACVGLTIQKNAVSNSMFAPPGFAGVGPLAPNEQATTQSGVRTADFMPGMIFEGLPGEEIKAFTPGPIAQTYGPYMESICRSIAAGCGISYSQFVRHAEGTFSAARQDMLMDRRTWQKLQDRLIENFIAPVYRLWLRFAVMEGHIAGLDWEEFAQNPELYERAKFLPDSHGWIDPTKDIVAAEKAITLGITTRREVIEGKGGDYEQVTAELSEEAKIAARYNIVHTEDVANAALLGKSMTNVDAVIAQIEGIQTAPVAPPAKKQASLPLAMAAADEPSIPPAYRPATTPVVSCATCTHLKEQKCQRYHVVVRQDYRCDDWMAGPTSSDNSGVKGQPPGPPTGQEPLGGGDSFDNPIHNPAATNSY